MAKLTIHITHVAWRDGRPRFIPGPRLRGLGFKGQDLRRPDGGWMSEKEALAWAEALDKQIATRVTEVARAKEQKKKVQAIQAKRLGIAGPYVSVEALFEMYWKSPRMSGEMVEEGKRRQRPRAPKTIQDYKNKARALGEFDGDIWTGPVDTLTRPIVFDLFERLWEAKGIHMARGIIAVLSSALGWAIKRGKIKLTQNPCLQLGMEMPEARLRALTPAEVKQLIAAADTEGRPEIGDAIALGVWTGQRQSDRLALQDVGLVDGRRLFKQNKTGALVAIPQAPELEARLSAAKLRRKDWRVQPMTVLADEQAGQSFSGDRYRKTFADIRAAAAKTMPSLADVRDQDLRDTSVTWLARAGCTVPEIAAITGHSTQSVYRVLRHYLASHPELADNAIRKLVAWYDEQVVKA